MEKIDIQKQFKVKVNKDAERYEFNSVDNNSVSYTVGFHEVGSLEDAYIAVYLAIEKNQPAPPSSPTATAEKEELFEILRKLGFNVSPFAVKEIPIVLKCMTEYASLKEQEARSRMIRVVQSRLNSVKINLIDAPKSEYLKGQKVAYQEVLDFLEDKPY